MNRVIARFRAGGRSRTGSPMPWEAFARMTDDDLAAIYRYLKTLTPTEAHRRGARGKRAAEPGSGSRGRGLLAR